MPSDLSARVENDEAMPPEARKWKQRANAAEAKLAALKATFDENQRERFARYAEEHAKVLGLEADRANLLRQNTFYSEMVKELADERDEARSRLRELEWEFSRVLGELGGAYPARDAARAYFRRTDGGRA